MKGLCTIGLLVALAASSPAAPLPGSLTKALAERDLGKRSKLALDNAGVALKEARAAYLKGDSAALAAAAKEFEESVVLCWDSLESTGKNPRKSPKWFKRAEIETRNLLKKLRSLQDDLPFQERSVLDHARDRTQKIHDDLLMGLMQGKK